MLIGASVIIPRKTILVAAKLSDDGPLLFAATFLREFRQCLVDIQKLGKGTLPLIQ